MSKVRCIELTRRIGFPADRELMWGVPGFAPATDAGGREWRLYPIVCMYDTLRPGTVKMHGTRTHADRLKLLRASVDDGKEAPTCEAVRGPATLTLLPFEHIF